MDTIYIEASIVSHASARQSSNIPIAAIQYQARTWWSTERTNFELVTSQLVIDEASVGDPSAAADRLKLLTLNCKHIANTHELPCVYRLLDDHGFGQLLICTPSEFLGGDDDNDKESDS